VVFWLNSLLKERLNHNLYLEIIKLELKKALKGGPVGGPDRKLYETGSTSHASCHCPQQNNRPFKKVVAIWEDKKKGCTLTIFVINWKIK